MSDNTVLLNQIAAGKNLQHVETEDKSVPKLESMFFISLIMCFNYLTFTTGNVHIGSNPRTALFAEVQKEHKLQHVDTDDKGAPVIDSNVHVGTNPMKGVLADIAKKGE
jgi:hypothetical protein